MSKFLGNLKLCYNGFCNAIQNSLKTSFKCCFPLMNVLIVLLNVIFTLIGFTMLFGALLMYIVPSYHVFVDSLKYIFNIHTIFGTFIAIGFITTVVGILGIYFLVKRQYEKLGLQAASFLVILIVMSSIVFTFYTEWEANAHFGVSYATQSFNPQEKSSKYFKEIQCFLKCCGALGPSDYDIGNQHFKKGTIPRACCDIKSYSSKCNETNNYWILNKYGYRTGCITRMEATIWPCFVFAMATHSILSALTMIITAIAISGYHAYIKQKCSHPKSNENNEYNDNSASLIFRDAQSNNNGSKREDGIELIITGDPEDNIKE